MQLAVLRFLTGMGAGGALPNASALTAELAPFRRRPVAVTFTIVCVPLGGMIGGLAAARILPAFGWRALYGLGGLAPLLFALVMLLALPESPRYLVRRPARWNELARLLRKMGHSLPNDTRFEDRLEPPTKEQAPLKSLLSRGYLRDTLGLWFAFFFSLHAAYLLFGWLPTMLTAQGLDLAAASSGLAAYNFGGVLGVLLFAPMVSLKGSRGPLLLGALAGAAAALAVAFVPVQSTGSHALLIAGLAVHGFFGHAVQTNMFALAAHVYPTRVRASGVAFAGAVGRLGGLMSSFAGAIIIQAGSPSYLGVVAACLVLTFVGLAIMRNHFPGTDRTSSVRNLPTPPPRATI